MLKQTLQAILVLLLLLSSGATLHTLNELHSLRDSLRAELGEASAQTTEQESEVLHSFGTGGDKDLPYTEWVGVYDRSTLYDISGAPSLRFSDLARDDSEKPRDFEIGFYRYGPTWYTQNAIIEFWIGSGQPNGGTFSIAGNQDGGGQLHVRNPLDTDGISIDFRNAERPLINTESGIALHFAAQNGLISENMHRFEQGITIPVVSDYAGQVNDAAWNDGAIIIQTKGVTAASIVLITPTSPARGQWWVAELREGELFTVASSAQDETMSFNWLIINGD